MSPRRFLALLVAALATIGLAFWLSTQRGLPRDADFGTPVLPGLAGALDAVDGVRLVGAGEATLVTLTREDGRWRVAEASYPADAGRVRGLLAALGALQVVEPKTALPENHPALGVEDLAAPTASGVRVELRGGPTPLALIVGRREGPGGVYVRRPGEARALAVRPALDLPRTPGEWLARRILDLPAERLATVDVGTGPFAPAPGTLQAGVLGNLEFDEVRPADAADGPAARVATYRSSDGLAVRLEGRERGAERWLAVAAAAERPEAAAEATRLAETTRGWLYRVPPFRYEAIFRAPDAPQGPRP